jgi:hypothetical protein
MVVSPANGTITIAKTGSYSILITVSFQSAGTTGQWGQLVKNNTTVIGASSAYSQTSSAGMQVVLNYAGDFVAGDFIDVRINSTASGTIGILGYSYNVVQGSGFLPVTVLGNVFYKQCQVIDKLQSSTADEGDLILLNGRLKSTLTAAQQAVATACGYGTNLFDGVGKMLVGSGSGFTPLSTGGSATSIIGQANLPNISLTSNLVSAGTPSGSIANTVTATYHSATGDGFNGGRIQLTDRAGFNVTNPSEMTVSSSFTGTALGNHQHTSSLGGSGTPLSTQNPYGVVAKYVYLGVANPVVTASQALSLTTTGTGASTFDSGTGILNVPYEANTFNNLKNATATNTIDNTNFAQNWNWSTATTQNPLTVSTPALTTGSALTVTPSANATGITNNGRLVNSVGTTTNTTPILATGSINDFLEVKIKNTSTGIQAQSGFTAEADNGSATTGFAWWGINNSTFNFPTLYNAGVINDVTLVGSGQDLIIANANQTKAIKFQTGRATTPFFDTRMTILNSGFVGVNTITPLSTFDNIGSVGFNIVSTAAAAYTVLATDYEINLTLAGVQAVTLPAVTNTRRVIILRNATSTANKTVTSYTGLDGVASTSIPAFGKVTLHSNGTTWLCSDVSIQQLPNVQTFTASGTYTKSIGCKYAIVEMVGAGGAGGYSFGSAGANTAYIGSGGGSGAYVKMLLTSAQIGTSQAVTVGATSGAASSLGTLATANGGASGANIYINTDATTTSGSLSPNIARATFTITTGTDLGSKLGNLPSNGFVSQSPGVCIITTSDGADSELGKGARGIKTVGPSQRISGSSNYNSQSAAANSGGGASGDSTYSTTVSSGVASATGNGGSGKLIITEYFQ